MQRNMTQYKRHFLRTERRATKKKEYEIVQTNIPKAGGKNTLIKIKKSIP
jgi:hypothetical protein